MVKESLGYESVMAGYQVSRNERFEWEAEWRDISEYLLPGRGIYQTYAKPRKKKLTSPKVINTIAEDALYVLTSGMHGGLTSPSRPWFKLAWVDESIQNSEFLKGWLQECEKRVHNALNSSNFYSIINSFYTEYAGFGTGCIYVGEDSVNENTPFRFELLTAGEYSFDVGADGKPSKFWRTIFMTPLQLVQRFPDTVSAELKKEVKKNRVNASKRYVTVVEYITREPYQDKPFTRLYYEVTGASGNIGTKEPLEKGGYYEFPYPISRWTTIGSDIWGIGPGSRALPDIKRLQEMEKAFLMAVHKTINPPLNVPGRMRGKLNTLPGGENYYANPNETVNEVYQVRFDYQGVSGATERVEQRIQRNFFNDIFLTGARDPNASPLKATQVNAQEQEKMLRLGPVIERLQHEFLQPIVERLFNIMLRKDLMPELPPDLAEQAGSYNITMVSPLASAQKAVAMGGIQSFLGFAGQAAQFDQAVLDNLDADLAIREMADISGVDLGILRPMDDVLKIREDRAKAQKAQQEQQMQMQGAAQASQMNTEAATAQKTQAEAGVAQMEQQQMAQDMGVIQ